MNNIFMFIFLALLTSTASASSFVYGRVIYVEPVYRDIYIRQPRSEWVCDRYTRDRRNSDALVGAIIGGAVGRQFGDGDGRDAATVAGALLGGSIGYDRGRRYGYSNENCYWVRDNYDYKHNRRSYPDGYYVTYTINGRDRHTVYMNYDPGGTVRVRID